MKISNAGMKGHLKKDKKDLKKIKKEAEYIEGCAEDMEKRDKKKAPKKMKYGRV